MKNMHQILKETGFREVKSKGDYKRVGLSPTEDTLDERYDVWYYIDKRMKSLVIYDKTRKDWDVTLEEKHRRNNRYSSYIFAYPMIPEFKKLFYGFKRRG